VKIEENSMIQIIEGQIEEVEKTEGLAKNAENRVSMAFDMSNLSTCWSRPPKQPF
jgi:hypothetical protein